MLKLNLFSFLSAETGHEVRARISGPTGGGQDTNRSSQVDAAPSLHTTAAGNECTVEPL